MSASGEGVGGSLVGIVCTVDLHKRDTEVKLFLGCTPAEMQMVVATHNSGPQVATLLPRPPSHTT